MSDNNNNIYQALINHLPDGHVKNTYLTEYIKNGNITFNELIGLLNEYTKDGKKINNYIVDEIIKDRKMDSFEELDILLKNTNTDFTFSAKFNFFNKVSCSEYKSIISLYNLLFMYKVLLEYTNNNDEIGRNTYLANTNYFNKIIFLKFLLFFQRLNRLKLHFEKEKNEQLNNLLLKEETIHKILKVKSLQEDTSFVDTLVDIHIVQNIYNIVINNIQYPTFGNIEQYKTLFNYNTTNKPVSKTASFFVGFHGTLMLINLKGFDAVKVNPEIIFVGISTINP